MTDHDLTAADGFDLVTARKHSKVSDEMRDVDHPSINRWTGGEHDRLYLNDLKTGDGYVDLQTGEVHGESWGASLSGYARVEDGTLTVKISSKTLGGLLYDDFEALPCKYELVINIAGLGSEDDDADDEGDTTDTTEPAVATDGGRDLTAHVPEDVLADAAEGETTTGDLRDLFTLVQRDAEEAWSTWLDDIAHGDTTLVAETDDVIVLSTGPHKVYQEIVERVAGRDALTVHDNRVLSDFGVAMHELAREYTDYDWGASYPLVLRKPDDAAGGRDLVEAHLEWLMGECNCSGAEAVDYYMTEWRDRSQSSWARATGRDQSTVSKTVSRARDKILR